MEPVGKTGIPQTGGLLPWLKFSQTSFCRAPFSFSAGSGRQTKSIIVNVVFQRMGKRKRYHYKQEIIKCEGNCFIGLWLEPPNWRIIQEGIKQGCERHKFDFISLSWEMNLFLKAWRTSEAGVKNRWAMKECKLMRLNQSWRVEGTEPCSQENQTYLN